MENNEEVKTTFPEINFDEFPIPSNEEWKEACIKLLKGKDYDKTMYTQTYEGITLNPIYRLEDTNNLTNCKAYPAQGFNLRGTKAGGYMTKLWTIAQETDGKTPSEVNVITKKELLKGSTAIAFTLDTATREGLDASDLNKKDVSDCGVSISILEDLETIFSDINVAETEFNLYAGASVTALLSNVAAYFEKQGIDLKQMHGAIAADPMGELLTDGKLPRHLDEYYDEMAHSIAWAEKHTPNLRTVLIDTDVYHNGGGNGIQESAFAMNTASDYLKAMKIRGIDANTFAKHLRFHFSIGANFFMEIAKLRSLKTVWAQIIKAYGGDEEAQKINLFVSTSAFTQTVFDPYVNLLRASTQAFSAVIGGMDGMNVRPLDQAIRPSDDFTRRIARNNQIMMQNEFNFTEPVDPVGGSWYIEPLTIEFSEKTWTKFQEIEKAGGLLKAAQEGKIQKEINEILEARLKNLAKRKDKAVGNNMYPNMTEELLEIPEIDYNKLLAERTTALATNVSNRDESAIKAILSEIKNSDGNECGTLMDLAIKAMILGTTMGEINSALSGETTPLLVDAISPHHWTEKFEELRKTTKEFKAKTGENITIFLANMGPIPQHKGRADFVTSFMEVAGFDVSLNNGFATVEEAIKNGLKSKHDICIVCSSDKTYPELAPAICKGIKAGNPSMKVMLAGAPSAELKELCDAAGFDDYISVKSNCYETLRKLQKERGMF